MASPAPARRRITPQLVQSPSASQQEATGFEGLSAARSVPPAVAPAQPNVMSKAGAGRRIYVDINASNTVNWREVGAQHAQRAVCWPVQCEQRLLTARSSYTLQLLKQHGVGKKRAAQQPATGLPGAPGLSGLGAQEPLVGAQVKHARTTPFCQ